MLCTKTLALLGGEALVISVGALQLHQWFNGHGTKTFHFNVGMPMWLFDTRGKNGPTREFCGYETLR